MKSKVKGKEEARDRDEMKRKKEEGRSTNRKELLPLTHDVDFEACLPFVIFQSLFACYHACLVLFILCKRII